VAQRAREHEVVDVVAVLDRHRMFSAGRLRRVFPPDDVGAFAERHLDSTQGPFEQVRLAQRAASASAYPEGSPFKFAHADHTFYAGDTLPVSSSSTVSDGPDTSALGNQLNRRPVFTTFSSSSPASHHMLLATRRLCEHMIERFWWTVAPPREPVPNRAEPGSSTFPSAKVAEKVVE
jgi:hypothetical protein